MKDIPREKLKVLARAHPVAWAMYASEGRWKRAKHLLVLADYLMKLHRGEIKRLAISFPPRHGKSELVSKYFSSWWLGTRPRDSVILCSYGAKLTLQWTRAARDMFAQYAPEVFGLDTWTRSAAQKWDTFKEGKRVDGGMFGIGKGGGLTGMGADLLIIDDLIRDGMEARNPTLRDSTWDWLQEVAMTRLAPEAPAIMIGTRWHYDDPIGRVETMTRRGEGGLPWTIINFPALSYGEDPLEREPGEALWPERFPAESLEEIREARGPRVWNALYQGRPTPDEGGLFKASHFKYASLTDTHIEYPDGEKTEIDACIKFGTVDLAASTKTSADYTVAMVFLADKDKKRLSVIDVVRKRVEGPDLIPLLHKVVDKWGLSALYVEKIGFQLSLIQHALREGLPVRAVKPDRDKVSRALPATAAIEGGQVYFRKSQPWLSDFEMELCVFDKGSHDDQVDCLAYGVLLFRGMLRKLARGARRQPVPRRDGSWSIKPWG